MITMKRASQSTLLIFLMVAIVVPAGTMLLPHKAHAQVPTIDLTAYMQRIKDMGLIGGIGSLDGIAWSITKGVIIPSMTRSTVNWINSGFNGSPAFVTDLRANLLAVSDATANQFFNELFDEAASGIIKSPYQDEIATAVRTGYYLSTGGKFYVRNPFTLDQYSNDPQAFLAGDFSQGGFNAFYASITNPQNNPYGAYQTALGELDRRLASTQGRLITELGWGDGFKGFRECARDSDGSDAVALAQIDDCQDEIVRTPGTVISNRINSSLGLGEQSLVTADEVDEVLGALFTQLVNQVLGSGGLLGVSSPSSGGGRSYIDQATAPPVAPSNAATEAQVLSYQANWKKVEDAARTAFGECSSSAFVQTAFSKAATAAAKAQSSLFAMQNNAPGSISITTQDVAEAEFEASASEGSLYSELTQIVIRARLGRGGACPS